MFDQKTMEIFSSRDMIRTQLIEHAQSYLDISSIDMTKNSYLSYLINILSVLTSNLIYYNTAIYREFFLVRAQQKESVLNLSAMIGYRPDLAIASTAQILISMPCEFKSSTTFTMYGRYDVDHDPFKFYADDVVFSNENEIQISVIMDRGRLLATTITEVNKDTGGVRNLNWRLSDDKKWIYFVVNATQTEDVTTTFTFPRLKPYEYYTTTAPLNGDFAGINVQTSSVKSRFDGVDSIDFSPDDIIDWVDKASLFLVDPGEYAYTYRVNDTGVKVFFGNGVVGTQPTEGHECKITITTTKGFNGNVLSGTINRCDKLSTTVTVNGKVTILPVNLKVLNTSPATGGEDYPTIDQIRSRAITQVSTNKRLVAQYDYNNASDIIQDIPIQHSLPVLKRSDLKRNEICLFTDLLFQDTVVPTKNAVIKIPTGTENTPIRFGDVAEIDYNRFEDADDYTNLTFLNMFDIYIDTTNRTCSYYYVLDTNERELAIQRNYKNETTVLPTSGEFQVFKDTTDASNDYLSVKAFYQKITDSTTYANISCTVEFAESGTYYDMTAVDDTTAGTYFYIEQALSSITEGNINFGFRFSYLDSSTGKNVAILDCSTDNVIKQNLDSFMYSKVKKYSDSTANNGYWGIIYDVPLVLKDYLDELAVAAPPQTYNFVDEVLQRIATFDVTEYRMLTDYVNLKFSNTYGIITNMNHNKTTKGNVVNRIDPETLPGCPGDGYCCAVTNSNNVWNVTPWFKTKGGFLATYYTSVTDGWVFTDLKTNDVLSYDAIIPGDPYRVPQVLPTYLPKLIYNGDNLYEMIKSIPLDVKIEVWKQSSFPISDSGMISIVKETLINYFADKLGYDKSIYVSDITRTVQDITGVDYCKVLSPEHDIFFNYDFDTFEHEDLLRYSPQLVSVVSSSISVTIRK